MSQSQENAEADYQAADGIYRAVFGALKRAEQARRVAFNRRLQAEGASSGPIFPALQIGAMFDCSNFTIK